MTRVLKAAASAAAVAAVVLAFAIVDADGALAASATMTVTNVTFDPPASDPACTAPVAPKGGAASASYKAPNGAVSRTWEWTVPPTVFAGATASIKTGVETTTPGGDSSSIGISAPSEFGLTGPNVVNAVVPVGAPGRDAKDQSYTF